MKAWMRAAAALALAGATAARAQQGAPPPAAAPPAGQSLAGAINQNQNARRARALLQAAIRALGGQAYMNITDMEEEGKSYAFDHGESGFGVQFWLFRKWPDQERVELTKQRDVIYIYNRDRAYEKTFKGTRALNPQEMAEYLGQRDFGLDQVLRRWSQRPDVALFYEGQTMVNNLPADQVSLMDPENQAVTLYLDLRSHLPLKESFTLRDNQGNHDTYEEIYGNYRPVQGVETPFELSRFHNHEQTRQRFLTSVRYNLGLADSEFTATVTYDPDAKPRR